MTDATLVRLVREHFEGLFPKTCPRCGRRFQNLRDYITQTERIGPALSYDVEEGDWAPEQPLGTLVVANCSCGTTLALSTEGMPLPRLHAGLNWLKVESRHRRQTPEQLLSWLRDEVRRQVLAGPAPQKPG